MDGITPSSPSELERKTGSLFNMSLRTHALRTPQDDAPPYDPSLWEGKDCAFVTRLARERAAKRQADAILQESQSAAAASSGLFLSNVQTPPPAAFGVNHTQGVSIRNRTLWEKVYNYFFPHKEPVPLSQVVQKTSIDDLTMRLQAALSAGDVGLATIVSAELATRRVHLRPDAFFLPQQEQHDSAPPSASILTDQHNSRSNGFRQRPTVRFV